MKRSSRSWKKKFVALGLLAGAGAAGTGAFALWSSTGSGSGSSKALTAVNVTINNATASADLYPGFTGGDLAFSLTNTNPYPITFTSMTPGTVTSSNAGACAASNVTVSPVTGLSLVVAANSTSAPMVINDAVSMSSGALDGCQGITFTVAMTLTGSQS